MAFTTFDPASDTLAELVSAIFTPSPGVTVQSASISARYGVPDDEKSTISFYDGSITGLNIGAGLLLTSGDPTPPGENTEGSYGVDAGFGDVDAPDADLQGVADAAWEDAGEVEDVTYLVFQINVTDPAAVGLRFEVVFASDEYSEWSDSTFVDVAGVFVNGTNYALFNNNVEQPLSVIEANIEGNFRDNENVDLLPIEYDGVSIRLQITAPLQQGLNTIKIGVADTGDSDYDSALFVSGMQAVNYAGYGLSQQVNIGTGTTNDSPSNQTYIGTSGDNTMHFGSQGGGQDVYDGGAGLDQALFDVSFGGFTWVWDGSVGRLIINNGANSTTLVDVERVMFGDGLYVGLDMLPGDTGAGVYAMLLAAFHQAPSTSLFSQWLAQADDLGGDLGEVGDLMIDLYGSGFSDSDIIAYLYQSIVGAAPSQQTLEQLVGLISEEVTIGDLFAAGSAYSLYGEAMAGVVGVPQVLDYSFFD